MSPNFDKVKAYYDRGLWSVERVRNAVVKGWITAEEFELITGEPYTPPAEEAGTDASLEQRVTDLEGDVDQVITGLEGVAT